MGSTVNWLQHAGKRQGDNILNNEQTEIGNDQASEIVRLLQLNKSERKRKIFR